MSQQYANFSRTTIATAVVNAGDLTFDVVNASLFPTLAAGDYFYAVLVRMQDGKKEIVKVTAITGNTFTVLRAQDGTVAMLFVAGDRVEYWITAQLIRDLQTGTVTSSNSYTDAQIVIVDASISALTADLATTDSNVATLQGQMTTAQSDIATLQGQMATVNAGAMFNSFEIDLNGDVWVKKSGVRINRLT